MAKKMINTKSRKKMTPLDGLPRAGDRIAPAEITGTFGPKLVMLNHIRISICHLE
jgi:hypothetical protein